MTASRPTAPTLDRWIDLLLVAGGVGALVVGQPIVGVPCIALGLVVPALRWQARRRSGAHRLEHLVPAAVATLHRRVIAASRQPGIDQPAAAVRAADGVVVEVAAVLAGRPVRGRAQRQFVAVRLDFLTELVRDLDDRSRSWRDALAELDALSPGDEVRSGEAGATPAGRRLATVLLILLAPVFALVDLGVGSVRAGVALVVGVVLRVRALARAGRNALGQAASFVARAARAWIAVRQQIVSATKEARARFVASRVRLCVRLLGSRR